MDDKRMIGDYTVLNSMYVGHKEIAICENQKAAKDERYLCCYIENVVLKPSEHQKQMVADLVRGKHFFVLTQMYRLKNRI